MSLCGCRVVLCALHKRNEELGKERLANDPLHQAILTAIRKYAEKRDKELIDMLVENANGNN